MSADARSGMGAALEPRHDYYERQKTLFAMVFVVVSIVPLLFLNYNASRFYQDSWIDNTSNALATLAADRKEIVDRFLTAQQDQLAAFLTLYKPRTLAGGEQLARLFAAVNASGAIVDLGVIDPQGRQVAFHGPSAALQAGNNHAATSWFAATLKQGRHVSDVINDGGEPRIIVAVADADRRWVLRASIDLERFFSLLSAARVGPEGDVFIVNRSGVLQTPSRLDRAGVTAEELRLFGELAARGGITRHDKDRITCATALNGGQWLLVMENNLESSLASYYEARRLDTIRLTVATAMIVLLAVVLTYSMIGRLSRAERERSLLTGQVGEVEKMALIGRLAASVAHEINNPLQLILSQVGLVSDLLESEDPARVKHLGDYQGAMGKIRTQISRAGTITRRLLGFSRAADGNLVELDVNQAVEETAALFEHEAKRNRIVLVRRYQEGLPTVASDPAQLQQVVLNVLHNAMDAIGEAGAIEITSRLDNGRLVVDFADSGPGLTAEVMEHLYDPFFTTKPKGKGTGLGLYVSRDIMAKLGGELIASNREGGGAIFSLRLPLRPGHEEAMAGIVFS